MPDIELERLTKDVLEELQIVMEDNPNMTEEDAIDWAYELADAHTPVYNRVVLELAANNLSLIGYRPIPGSGATPVEVARLAVFDYLKEVVYSEWHRLESKTSVQVLERETPVQKKENTNE